MCFLRDFFPDAHPLNLLVQGKHYEEDKTLSQFKKMIHLDIQNLQTSVCWQKYCWVLFLIYLLSYLTLVKPQTLGQQLNCQLSKVDSLNKFLGDYFDMTKNEFFSNECQPLRHLLWSCSWDNKALLTAATIFSSFQIN